MAGAAAAEVEQEDEDWDERVVKRRGGEAWREWWEAGEKAGGRGGRDERRLVGH
jgi:hypothetical protein